MERRDWMQRALLAAGTGLAGGSAQAQVKPPEETEAERKARAMGMLEGQEAAGTDPREIHAYSMGIQAFQWGFPLIYFGNLMWQWTLNPRSVQRYINAWITTRHFVATSFYQDGGSFNTDTVYTGAFIDLRKEPIVLSPVDPQGHYFSVQISDLYTHNPAYISKRSGGPLWGHFLLVPPGWKGEIPAGKFDRVIHCEQRWMFALIRLRIDQDDEKEIAWAKERFAATRITPLSDFLAGREFVPSDRRVLDVGKLIGNPLRPFAILNHMLAENPPAAAERAFLQGFKTVGIGPGMDLSHNGPEVNRGLARAARDGIRALRSHVERPWARSVNGWNYFPRQIGQPYTDDYLMRAAWQSLWGIVAHPPHECTYLWATADQHGERLNSRGKYELFMTRDQFPKVEAFWSVTLYQDFNLVINEINRWAIRENTKGLKFGADGSLRVYIQAERPGDDKLSNWLPAPKAGNFNLTMRNYMPSQEIIEQRYDPPVLTRLG